MLWGSAKEKKNVALGGPRKKEHAVGVPVHKILPVVEHAGYFGSTSIHRSKLQKVFLKCSPAHSLFQLLEARFGTAFKF